MNTNTTYALKPCGPGTPQQIAEHVLLPYDRIKRHFCGACTLAKKIKNCGACTLAKKLKTAKFVFCHILRSLSSALF